MSEQHWKTLTIIQGELPAEILQGLLEAQGIPTMLSQEGAGRAYGFGVGPLSEVEIMVPDEYLAAGQRVIEDWQAGKFEELGNQLDEEDNH